MPCSAGSLRGRKGLGFKIDFCLHVGTDRGGNAECGFCRIDWKSLDEKVARRDPEPGCYYRTYKVFFPSRLNPTQPMCSAGLPHSSTGTSL